MRRLLISIPVVTAILWLALGTWAYALEREPTSYLYGFHLLPQNKNNVEQCL